jgi:hypothetical protein
MDYWEREERARRANAMAIGGLVVFVSCAAVVLFFAVMIKYLAS